MRKATISFFMPVRTSFRPHRTTRPPQWSDFYHTDEYFSKIFTKKFWQE